MPLHSSYLLQPLDFRYFSPLKRAYGRETEEFMKLHVNHITMAEYLIAVQTAYSEVSTPDSSNSGFRGAGLVLLDPDKVI